MALYSPAAFHRSPSAGFDGIWNWDFLHGSFGPKIKPMDFDGVVERNGFFLIFETKDEGKAIPQGQQIALGRMVQTGRGTVVCVWGKNGTKQMETWSLRVRDQCKSCGSIFGTPMSSVIQKSGVITATDDDVRRFSAEWFRKVDAFGEQ